MCWHKWGKWVETARGELLRYTDSADLTKKIHVGQVSYQERICQKCNAKQLHCATARISPDYVEVTTRERAFHLVAAEGEAMRVLNDNNQWVGDGQILDRDCECVHHRRRLKCVVNSVKSVADSNGDKQSEELGLSAVYSGSEANKQWSKWTPAASLTMTISNPAAFGKVLPGQFFFVDLTPTDKES
jgi:hypothetical protein